MHCRCIVLSQLNHWSSLDLAAGTAPHRKNIIRSTLYLPFASIINTWYSNRHEIHSHDTAISDLCDFHLCDFCASTIVIVSAATNSENGPIGKRPQS